MAANEGMTKAEIDVAWQRLFRGEALPSDLGRALAEVDRLRAENADLTDSVEVLKEMYGRVQREKTDLVAELQNVEEMGG